VDSKSKIYSEFDDLAFDGKAAGVRIRWNASMVRNVATLLV
jgi:hypothetical protein